MLIRRQKLSFHAKRKTVMNKDMEILRDIWKTIDPESPIGRESGLTLQTRLRHFRAEQNRIGKLRLEAARKAERLRAHGMEVPPKLAHFLRNAQQRPS